MGFPFALTGVMFSPTFPLSNRRLENANTHMWISPKNLKHLDEISIRTENSVYLFRVTDPTQGTGILGGGLLGEVQHEASLSDELATEDQKSQFTARLEIGCCALFYVYIGGRLRRLTTSEIQDVSWARIPSQASTVRLSAPSQSVF